MKISVLIVDDEEPARHEMRQLLSALPGVSVIGEAGDVETALALTVEHQPGVCFLDIRLAGESGFDYVARVGERGPRLVFVTAHDRYAIRGFECNAMDYLLKPVALDRLAESLRRLEPRKALPSNSVEDPVFFKGTTSGRFATWTQVSHIRTEGNYSRVFFVDGTDLLMLRPLKEWDGIAPKGFLQQVHRTALVQRRLIRELRVLEEGRREVVLSTGQALPVGRAYWGELKPSA